MLLHFLSSFLIVIFIIEIHQQDLTLALSRRLRRGFLGLVSTNAHEVRDENIDCNTHAPFSSPSPQYHRDIRPNQPHS